MKVLKVLGFVAFLGAALWHIRGVIRRARGNAEVSKALDSGGVRILTHTPTDSRFVAGGA
jgi:hypothetical protein